MLGRNISLRSRRRPNLEFKPAVDAPAQLDSGSAPDAYTSAEQRSTEPLRSATLEIRSQGAQFSDSDHTVHPYQPLVDTYPPGEMIGVALGSPSHNPLPPLSSDGETSWTTRSPEPTSAYTQPSEREALRAKGSRWKGFGGIFGKRSGLCQDSPASSRYQIDEPSNSAHSHQQHQLRKGGTKIQDQMGGSKQNGIAPRDWIGPEQLRSPEHNRDHGFHRKTSLRRNNVLRKQANESQKAEIMESNPLKRDVRNGSTTNDWVVNQEVGRARSQGRSLLQVEIPNVELERYSVMFSALLYPGQQISPSRQPSPKRQPSLLARRQANVQELQTSTPLNIERPWVRAENFPRNRAASPNKSPSFSLFPPSPTAGRGRNHSSTRERSPLQRSATAPGAVSPSKAKFDFSGIGEQQDQVIVIVRTPTEQPKPQRRVTSEDFCSHMSSERDTFSEDTFTTARSFPLLSAESTQTPLNARNPSPQRPLSPQKPVDGTLQKAAEISIARQISISQRQRQLLVPGVPKVAPQPVQPKIVNVQRQGSRSRKSHHSHHLVLEDA
ncbi:MAG: hypothetical protein LQ346_000876 [Caloplaca aetnensis]|nr:MAG: hypothetical protein LQ346_000876 [Caloplaca aetnensis]